MNERFSVGANTLTARNLSAIIRLARTQGRTQDPVVRQRLADIHIGLEVMRFTNYRAITAVAKGELPGPEGSIIKLAWVRSLRAMAELAVELAGADGMLDGPASRFQVDIPGARLAGGTDEVLRNVVGERVLGLPAEPRAKEFAAVDGAPR